ncbi:hypothetical protein OCT63_18885 [Vibrio sp. RW]|uniref:hypothetical protein n=1 Tax=Vibrio sp. RW TaxID=2998833 RepID=UPI0022CD25BD|nr:hypothetical protein [Vibrio sp. RW]MDA0146293.1 hypothetical protein [Vibrio sp. RW]
MEIDPLEIFSIDSMPSTYDALCSLDVHRKLVIEFEALFTAKDLIALHNASALDEQERASAVKAVIANVSSRKLSASNSDQNSWSNKRIQL